VLYKRCEGLCQPLSPENSQRMSSSIHNADVQLNSHDCGVWTCYALYHRALQGAIHKEPADIFEEMNMKTPMDAKRFRSYQHTCCSLV
jgi:hypothetical protein